MKAQGGKLFGQLWLGSHGVSAAYIGVKDGAKVVGQLIWETIYNCIVGGWWQHGHSWQYGIGWSQKHK